MQLYIWGWDERFLFSGALCEGLLDSSSFFVDSGQAKRQATMAKYLVPASVLLSQSIAAASLFDSYVSLSFELIGFPTFAGEFCS